MIFKPVSEYIQQLIRQLAIYLNNDEVKLIGIHQGGVWIAEQVHHALKNSTALGHLDISFYRDDFSQIGLHPAIKPSQIPFSVDQQHIVLIDDIIQTGRTIRAAMNEIFDYGRPANVTLACLFELTGRELPIRPDVVVEQLQLLPAQRLKLKGSRSLKIELIEMEK